ncbi:SDR family oxidoreductase [Vibrio natriegens]|uniref:Short-chain dehydrogenase/reductase n=1 Tax=Vibrio natriegens NBRC 15636 = ATCC 14048 = DSM 759 TaxID=1219067 RepID=A0AAN0Y7E7_VIBNA|nr:SDR family oxidoreductase [Vibrio natriegens]ALR17909.1 short-chain dehydrogenase [Vibrio natriegens NBRC 15636 = ATCC 14048 = DSM 759]ANQ15402.1 short-chain dehydrogenase/reductase [Vibrio natriegens NBRC 15636 = ATCC 14048 = DSM 759]EPM41109.1 short-chain dehydrogenase [Vibrio natriegens NBRC 15636 = ATCC 14048 = DSM 759]MDX6029242.1 SDR family oxidoreductase [Vibrio natriegens NBRC 15636 = ATCC 14048 = DSM 759]UUI14051.1 SDR family oxidoreductase [Vibrio natriegens]
MSRIWFVTGTSRGMGTDIVKAALEQGDKVVATGRSLNRLREVFADAPADRIQLLELDVTSESQAQQAVSEAVKRFGRIDVLVNNAGYCLLGRFEEATSEQIEAQFGTNVFGMANVLRAVLPVMRSQGSGRIFNTSSIAGVKAVANATFYSASKFAVEGMTLALADEVAPFGIQVTAIEPGFFRTEFLNDSSASYGENQIEDYLPYGHARELLSAADGQQQGDPAKLANVIMRVANLEKQPKQLLIGNDAIDFVTPTLVSRLAETSQFASLTQSTDF